MSILVTWLLEYVFLHEVCWLTALNSMPQQFTH